MPALIDACLPGSPCILIPSLIPYDRYALALSYCFLTIYHISPPFIQAIMALTSPELLIQKKILHSIQSFAAEHLYIIPLRTALKLITALHGVCLAFYLTNIGI